MDEFAVDLDKVLDEFEQSEGGDVAEKDEVAREVVDEAGRAEIAQPQLAANFPAFEALDLDLDEADFAPSNFHFDASAGQENSNQNLSDPVPNTSGDADDLPIREVEQAQRSNNENGFCVQEMVDHQPTAQIPGEVDVLSACRHAVASPPEVYEPPVAPEQHENEVENDAVPAAPPDIVCSAPDLVSSAIVGVDVVPLSCTDASLVGNLSLNLDLTPKEACSDGAGLKVDRPDALIQGTSNPTTDLTADCSNVPAENHEQCSSSHQDHNFENDDLGLANERHVEELVSHLPADFRNSEEEQNHACTSSIVDVVANSQCADANRCSKDESSSSEFSVPTSSGVVLPYGLPICLSGTNLPLTSPDDAVMGLDLQPFGMVDQRNRCAGDVTCNDSEVPPSDFGEKMWSHDTDSPPNDLKPLPDISQISVSGVDLGKDLDSVSGEPSNTQHAPNDRLDQSCDGAMDHDIIAGDPDCLSSINGTEHNSELLSNKNKMPPAYWDSAEEDEAQKTGVRRSRENSADMPNDLIQTSYGDNSFAMKMTDEEEDGRFVSFSEKFDTRFLEIEDADVGNDLKQEGYRHHLNDPEIIRDGKVADTNFTEDLSDLTASMPDNTHSLHEIQSNGSTPIANSECEDNGEEIKCDLDLVSDVVMLESLPEFCHSSDMTCPDVAVSDNIVVDAKLSSSEDDSFTVVNSHSANISSAISNDQNIHEVFDNLDEEKFKSLMNEVAEEMEKMITQENADGIVTETRENINDIDVTGGHCSNDNFGKNRKNSFEDLAVFVQCNGSENIHSESQSGVVEGEEKTKQPGDASGNVSNDLSAVELEAVRFPQKQMSGEMTENSHNHEAGAVDSRFLFPERQKDGVQRSESAADATVSLASATNENGALPADSQEGRMSSEVSTGARQKQPKTLKPENSDVSTEAPVLPTDSVLMSSDAHPVTPAAVAGQGSQSRPTSILQTATSHPDAAASPTIPLCSNISLEITQLGKVAPVWLPDAEASKCMECQVPFSFTRRRHHCRACGKVFCHSCCSLRTALPYLENKQDRVCSKCYQDLVRASFYERTIPTSGTRPNLSDSDSSPAQAQASPELPCQPSAANPPTGVLRKQGSMKLSGEAKQVMFSDGVRPGGALTELDGSSEVRTTSSRRSRKSDKSSSQASSTSQARSSGDTRRTSCLIPSSGLPPVVIPAANGEFSLKDNVPPDVIFQQIKDEASEPVMFAINRDVAVLVKIVNLDCCVNRLCWCFTTKGLCSIGQDEIVIVLECLPDEKTVPVEILRHLHVVFEMASRGNTINNLDHTVLPAGSLGCQEIGGFLYVRQTFQCLQKLVLPDLPYLFGLVLQKWEMSWAKVFPLRLMFRLGAEFRYYPCPLISVRNRKPVYGEIGHTIMNLLADFHNFQYMVPRINGLTIHMEDKRTTVSIPRNRYGMLMKILSNSDDHVIALGASFSSTADSHLVCLQSDDGNYQTQAINIQNRPRQVTGACFIVFNGALKPTSGLRAKSSIVEDGLMVQVTSDAMTELKQNLSEMKDYKILCGSIEIAQPDEMVVIEWNNEEKNINQGVKSPIDGLSMFGIDSMRIHGSTDYAKDKLSIRWTEVFILRNGAANNNASTDAAPPDVNHLAESLAQACCQALVNHLSQLTFEMFSKIGLRVTIDSEQVGYEIGSRGIRLPDFCMNDLDEKLISVIHGAASRATSGPIVLELVFHIIQPYDMRSGTTAAPGTN